MLTEKDMESRKPVWYALSELWLDTELELQDIERIADVMIQSGYTGEVLRCIYLEEVAPVLYPNTLSPAGEWIGFDQEWLCHAILENIRHTNLIRRIAYRIAKPVMVYATERHWFKIQRIMSGEGIAQ